jgi:hypothetical protein
MLRQNPSLSSTCRPGTKACHILFSCCWMCRPKQTSRGHDMSDHIAAVRLAGEVLSTFPAPPNWNWKQCMHALLLRCWRRIDIFSPKSSSDENPMGGPDTNTVHLSLFLLPAGSSSTNCVVVVVFLDTASAVGHCGVVYDHTGSGGSEAHVYPQIPTHPSLFS